MKVRHGIDLEDLREYGFKRIIRKENKPFVKLCLEKPNFIGISETEFQNYIDEDNKFDNEYHIVDSESYHYFNEGDYINIIDYSRRGQYYYLLIDSETRIISIGATDADGNGDSVFVPDIFFDLIADDIIERD